MSTADKDNDVLVCAMHSGEEVSDINDVCSKCKQLIINMLRDMSTSENEGASKSNSDDVCDGNDKLQNMSICAAVSICANCGKEDDNINNTCNKCKMVKYCNAVCKKKHKKKHKKECEEHIRLAAERAAELHDEELFKQPAPEHEDCQICFLPIPTMKTGRRYQSCCGKMICSGCTFAPVYDNQGNKVDNYKCPFCRTSWPHTEDEALERLKKRMELDDPVAIYTLGCTYADGLHGLAQNYAKALKLWHRAAELGCAEAYYNIGYAYDRGLGVEVDMEKSRHYYELSAMRGNETARHTLGNNELLAGNYDRALKHYMIAARSGYAPSLKRIQNLYKDGHATKDDYTAALQSYQAHLGEIKSPQRDQAAAANEGCRYYLTGI